MEPQQCPECEVDLDEVTSVCPECGWDQMTPGDHHSGPRCCLPADPIR